MKKFISFVIVSGVFFLCASSLFAQEAGSGIINEVKELHNVAKVYFVMGGVPWMSPILILLILGLAVAIERIFYLNLATVNTNKLLKSVEEALEGEGGIEAAKEICRNTRGPVASIFYQGLLRADDGLEIVEKSIVSYGGVQMAKLENGMGWLNLFIAVIPSVGFLGTVVGMVLAFDAIAKAGDISPTIVAGGMMVALLTTVLALISAVILQFFYNYLLVKIGSMVANMEDSSISIMDILAKKQNKN